MLDGAPPPALPNVASGGALANTRGPVETNVAPGPPSAAAREPESTDAIRRELEAMGSVIVSAPPGVDREERLRRHRLRLLALMTEPSGGSGGAPAAPRADRAGTEAAAPPARFPSRSLQQAASRWRLDRRRLRRVGWLAGAIAAVALAGVLGVSQRAQLARLGSAMAVLGREGAGWARSWASRPAAIAPAPPQPSKPPPARPPQGAPGASRKAATVLGPRRPEGPRPSSEPAAAARKPAPGAVLDAPDAPAGATAGGERAGGGDVLDEAMAVTERGGVPGRDGVLQVGTNRYRVSALLDGAGHPSGLRLWAGGPRARMVTAYAELAEWAAARFGEATPQPGAAEPEEWRAGARWSTPGADVELRGGTNSLRVARVWALDLRGGAVSAVEDAEVVLVYRRNPQANRGR